MPTRSSHAIVALPAHARQRDGELRPLLLRVHAERFAALPVRDRSSLAQFELLALGLIPLVTDDVVSEFATILGAVPDVPTRVKAAVADRLCRTGYAAAGPADDTCGLGMAARDPRIDRATALELLDRDDRALDLALAGNRRLRLGGRLLAVLLARGRGDRALAAVLLERPELGIGERAGLYGSADQRTRDTIRAELAATLAAALASAELPAPDARDRVVAAAETRDPDETFRVLAEAVGQPDGRRWDLDDPGERELFVLALAAVGLSPVEVARVVLTFDGIARRTDGALFRLVAIARTTSRGVASLLSGPAPAPSLPSDDGDRRPAERSRLHGPARREVAIDAAANGDAASS